MAARGHGESVDLGLDVDALGRGRLEPGDVDLNVEVTNAANPSALHQLAACTHLQTMASSGMAEKCSPRMMSRQPVVVTKMFP